MSGVGVGEEGGDWYVSPGTLRGGGAISLEPAGQLELSGAAVADLHATWAELQQHLREVHEVTGPMGIGFASAIVQILALDMVFSIDSILTAIGMTDDLPVMIVAVVVAVGVMLFAATPLADFIARNPSVVMLALGFLLMIGFVLIADGFGVHVPKGYVYSAMAFAGAVETLNLVARRAADRKRGG